MRRMLMTALVLAATGLPAQAQTEGDAAVGSKLAEQHCARCHDIGPGGAMKLDPPSFAAIAQYRTGGQITDRIWFPAVHSNMPPFSQFLMLEDVQNLTAYIQSLDKP